MRTLIKYLDESLFKNQEQIKRMVKSDEIEFVDLGLSVKWAKCNLGAENETDYGHYYMWGSITPNDKDKCCWKNTPFNNGRDDFDENYFNSIKDKVCPNGILASEYDIVTHTNSDGYRMPTQEELEELKYSTNNEWVENYNNTNINGMKFTNEQDSTKFIFIPAAGYRSGFSTNFFGTNASVWSASLDTDNEDGAWCLNFNSGFIGIYDDYRVNGFSIRPVQDK